MAYRLLSLLFIVNCYGLVGQHFQGFEPVNLGNTANYSISYELAEDANGSIWVATDEGLFRYNSTEARQYNEYIGMPTAFSNKIQNVLVDGKQQVWTSSENYVAKFNPSKNAFGLIPLETSKESPAYIFDIKIFDDKLCMATFNGLWTMDQNGDPKTLKRHSNIPSHFISIINGKCIIGTNKGSYFFEKGTLSSSILSDKCITSGIAIGSKVILGTKSGDLLTGTFDKLISQPLVTNPILKLEHAPNNYILVATDGDGIILLSSDGKIMHKYSHDESNDQSLPINGIYDIIQDKNQNLWVATFGGGVVKNIVKNTNFGWIENIKNNPSSISNNFVRAILSTHEGDTWFGTRQGISIRKKNNNWKHISSLDGKGTDNVLTFYEDGEYVWVGTFGKGAFKVNKNSFASTRYGTSSTGSQKIELDKVFAIIRDANGTLWYGGIDGLLSYIGTDGKTGSMDVGQVRHMAASPDGKLYTVGRQGVTVIANNNSKNIAKLIDKKSFDYSTINCIIIDQNILWLGTNGDGLIKYNVQDDTYKVFNMSTGLLSDIVQSIILQKDKLWVSTSKGLASLNHKDANPTIRIYDERDGIKNASFIFGSGAQIDDNTLAFGTQEGVLLFDTRIVNAKTESKAVNLEYLEVLESKNSNKTQILNLYNRPDEIIELQHWQDFIKLKFNAIDHLNPDKYMYSWRMKGVTDEWSPATNDKEIYIGKLSSGKYTIELKTVDPSGQFGPVKSVKLKILNPWYWSGWAKMIYLLFLGGLSIILYRFSRTLIQKNNAEEQISFYNNITHELKTPLTILVNKLESTSDVNTYKSEVKITVDRLNSLFDQLLNFNKVSSSFYKKQNVSAIEIESHLKNIINSFQPEINKKNINLKFENNYNEQVFYYKKDILDKIFYNLLANAVKYTENGGQITIKINKNRNSLVLIVTDNGIGIPKDEQKHILKRYYRARNAINSQLPGTGLGLMMVKTLVEQDQGKMTFVSEPGLGTSFTVTLNTLKEDVNVSTIGNASTPSPESTVQTPSEPSSKYKILIVEDNDELRIDMVEKLSPHFSIMAARTGTEGYEKAKAGMPDLIVTDLIMPEMDGNELCRTLQKDESTSHIPVFMMTVLNDPHQQVESIKSGINTYMTKPIDFPFLIAKIFSVLEYKQKLRDKYIHETEISKSIQFRDEREAEFVKDLEEFILSRVKDEEIAVHDLCKHLGMSRTALYMKLKEMIDHSPQSFIIMTKLNHARKLLLQGGRTVQEVAFMVGFNNPKYFATSFKKQFGTSPSGFLKSLNPEDEVKD